MDFPRHNTTNVHKIEGVLFIQWTVYSPDQTTIHGPDKGYESFDRRSTILQEAENALRYGGYHVLYDDVQGVLWIFDLSGPNLKKDSRSDHQRGAAAVFEHYGLKKLLFGSLRASDLTDSTSTAQRLPLGPDYQYHSWLHPKFLYSTGRMHSGWTASVAQDNVSIFSKIVSAISMSLSFFLARSGRYTPLSSHFFLSLLPVESQPPNVRLRSPFEPAFYDVSFLEVQWLSCGTLVMLFYPDSYATWRCLGGPIPRSVLPDNLEIFLAPFGVPALYAATVPQQDPKRSGGDKTSPEAKNSIQSPKPTIIANLRQRGIKLSDDCKWSSVKIDPSNETVTDDGITHILPQFLIEWPTDLCFYRGYQADSEQRETSWLWPGLVNGARDSLKEADEWIRDKQRRDSALEKTRQEMEAEAKKSTLVSSTTEDLRSGKPSMVDQQIDAQSVSGVYPTPPDGFRSQAPGLNSELESSNTAKEQVDTDMLDEEKECSRTVKADDTADNALHDVEMNMGAYDNLEEDEMFGNLHSTMFSANGLTEDDFSFFDEPKVVTNMISNIHQAKDVQATLPPYLTPTDTVMLSEKVEGDEDIPMDDDYDESNEVFEIGNTEVNTLRSDVMEEPESQSEAMQQASERSSPRKADYNRHRQDSLREADIQLSIRPSKTMYAQKDSIFSAIPLKLVSRSMDYKYKDQGIYCSIEDHKVDVLPPKQYQLDKVIPMISQGAAHNNNTGDDDDTSESPTTSEVSSDSFLGMTDLADRQSHPASCVASPTSIKEERTEGVSPQDLQVSDSPISYEGDPDLSPHTLQSFLSDIYTGKTTTFIQVAQILADQLRVYSTLERLEVVSLSLYRDIFPMSEKSYPTQYDDPLRGIISTLFPQSEKCSLETCASTGETYRGIMQSQKAVIRPLQRRIDSARGSSDNMGSSTPIFPIDIPTVQALRGENLMELTATGLQFWDELGLSPSLGPKDILAFCIYPNTQMVHRGVISFMEQLSMTYQSLRLGSHDWGNGNIKDFTEGFAPVQISYEGMETTASHFDKVCERLGQLIAETEVPSHAIVVYIVNPFVTASSLPRMCESFLHCQKNYEAGFTGEKQASRTAIVLKLVPIEWVASIATIPLPSPKEYNMLAKDVYERCLTHTNPYASMSSIQLAEPIPKTLDFKVTANPTYNLARSPLTIHIAYTWPYGSEWLCLSAIDNLGRLHWEASYCFGSATESDLWPTFRAMVADIWSGALGMVDEPERKRSIYIVKDEPMHPEELDAWTTQKPPSSDQPSLITLILLCAEIAPPIYYSPTPSYLIPSLPEEPTTYATPASTPLPTAQTPTSSDPLASPGHVKSAENLEADPSARIVDPFEESWGIISTRAFYTQKFNLGPNIHSLGSGYLLKRAGPVDADGWIMLGVHVVAAERWSEGMMKELLTQWRALGLLARERGVETQKSTLPWHLAVARKCWRGVSARMKYVSGISK